MENNYENDPQKNYNCLSKLYNFQELMRTFRLKKNDSDNFFLINPYSLINYDEYCNFKDLKSLLTNKPKNKFNAKPKNIDITKLPIIQEKSLDESFIPEIKREYNVNYKNKIINLHCYEKIIIVNQEIKNLMTNINNFISEKIIFTNDKIAIKLKSNILEIFGYDNINRICKPRYIMIFEDQFYANKEIKELEKTEFINYINNKKLNKHIETEDLYNEKGKFIGEIINFNELLKQVPKSERQKIKNKIYNKLDISKRKIKLKNIIKNFEYDKKIKSEFNVSKNDDSINKLKQENNYNNISNSNNN